MAALAPQCAPSPTPAQPLAPRLELTHFQGPPGVELTLACSPARFELCFDAIDNNCNGAIDEGCGVRTGIIQFSIGWDDPTADVDLHVSDPKGEKAQIDHATTLGLVKDRDCPGENQACHGQNTENVYLVGLAPVRGPYRVRVQLAHRGQAPLPLRVRLAARIGQRSYATTVELGAEGQAQQLVFEM